MNFILLAILIAAEIVLCVMGLTRRVTKKEWAPIRVIVNIIEIIIYLIMILLPGIDFGFRFKALFLILCIRILLGLVFFFFNRRNPAVKKKPGIVLGAVLSIVLFAISMFPAVAFADYSGRPVTGSFSVAEDEAIIIDSSRIETFEKDGSFREIPVHFYYPEGIEEMEAQAFPLVIFSHGAFGYYQSNASTYMELASNGYVVVSLDHPYHSFFTKDSKGKTILVNMGFFKTALSVGNGDDEMTEEEVYEITSEWMELREADMNCVIDTIKEAAGSKTFDDRWAFNAAPEEKIASVLNAIDIEKIGLMGHSLGGATAVTVGRREDISAVIDLDGTMLGEETGVENGNPVINDEPYTTPLLSMDKETHHDARVEAKEIGYNYANNVILDNATAGFSTYFKGAEHMNFTDLPLFSPFLGKMLGSGTVDPGECIDQVNAIVLQFFDCYLKGEGVFTVNESY